MKRRVQRIMQQGGGMTITMHSPFLAGCNFVIETAI
jgi:hypothetical protein